MTRANAIWLALYLVFLAGIIWGTFVWRARAIVDLGTADNVQSWREFGQKIANEEKDNSPTRHTVSKRDEPPMLVYLKERFGIVVFGVVLFGSIFFGIAMFLARNLWASSYKPDVPPESESNS